MNASAKGSSNKGSKSPKQKPFKGATSGPSVTAPKSQLGQAKQNASGK